MYRACSPVADTDKVVRDIGCPYVVEKCGHMARFLLINQTDVFSQLRAPVSLAGCYILPEARIVKGASARWASLWRVARVNTAAALFIRYNRWTVVLSLLTAVSNAGVAAEPKSMSIAELVKGRPASFYVLQYSRDRSTCAELLSALNEPRSAQTIGIDPEFTTDLLLRSHLSVPWTPVSNGPDPTWSVTVDLNNDGRDETIYRHLYYLTGLPYWAMFWVDLSGQSSETSPGTNNGAQTTMVLHAELAVRGAQVEITNDTVKSPSFLRNFSVNDFANVEVVRIHGVYYLLLGSSIRPGGGPRLALLQSQNKKTHVLMCLLRSAYQLRNTR